MHWENLETLVLRGAILEKHPSMRSGIVGVVVAFVVFVSTVVDVSETFWAVVVVLSLGTHCVEASSQRKTQLTKTLLRTQ